MIKYSILLSIIFVLLSSCTQLKVKHNKNMSLINDVSFHNIEYGNDNAGNAFIVNLEGRDYAITAKHVLMIVKTDKMKFVDFAGELKQWRMYNKNNPSQDLIIDELLNTDKNEKLEWETLTNDWIVFSIKENNTGYQALEFRQEPLIKGETLYIVGWAYQDKTGPQRIYEYTFNEITDGLLALQQITGPESLAGLSGSPVVDQNNKVVGVVSTGWQNENTKISYVQASQANDIQKFIENFSKN